MRGAINYTFAHDLYKNRRNLILKIGVVLLFMSFYLTSCIDPIAFEAEETSSKVVIFGSFTDQNIDHQISIRRTGKFGTIGIALQGAYVELVDEDGKRAQYYETGEGTYTLPKNSIMGIPGKSYKLMVTLPSNNKYESSWQLMPEKVEMSSAHFNIDFRKVLSESDYLIQQFYIDIFIDTPVTNSAGEKAYLRWEVEETYSLSDFNCGPFDNAEVCYFSVPAEFGELKIFSSLDDSQTMLQNYLVFSRLPAPYIEFNELHYFNVKQFSLSKSTFDYWEKINVVSNPTGSIFDKLPSGVEGNMSEVDRNTEVLGYFEVASASIARTSITYQDVIMNIQIAKACNPYISYYFQPNYCCYCYMLPNTIPKPDYWGER